MKKQFQSNNIFLVILVVFCCFATVKIISEYKNLSHIESKIRYEESVILKEFLEAFRLTYQQIFINNHVNINEITLQFLPAVTISQISDEFQRVTKGEVTINTVTDRPRNPKNMADPIENEAIQYFKTHQQETEYFKRINTDIEPFFFYASPLFINNVCLKCHGPRESVIPSISKKYRTAYDYKEGDLRGIISVKMYSTTIKDDLINLFFIKTTIVTLLSGILFLAIIFYLIFRVRKSHSLHTQELEEAVHNKTKELREQVNLLQEYSKVLDCSAIVSKGDQKGTITYVNKQMCETTGYAENELLGQPHSILRHPDMDASVFQDMWKTILDKSVWQGLVKNQKKDKSCCYSQTTICPILDSDGNILEFLAARNDVTELVEKRTELQNLLTTDTLTNLPNRYQMLRDLSRLGRATVVLLDILDFADINDFFGIKEGDLILIEFTRRVLLTLKNRPSQLYRLHGDQLALLLLDIYQQDELKTFIKLIIASISDTPFKAGDNEIVVNITCGIACNLTNPLLEADIALKQAKMNRWDYAINRESSTIKQELQKNHNRVIQIKNALQEKRVVNYFQPILNAKTRKIEKYECLVRIIEKDGKVLSPFFFLPTAKKARIYTAITRNVIDNACSTFENSSYDFSINLSTEDILDSGIVKYLKTKLEKRSLADRAILEILETEGFENYDLVRQFIHEMKDLGCRIAIDDFGSGYSNYERLLNLHVDYLKIDGSIIKKITSDDVSLTIVEAIIAVSSKLGIKTVAEFVFDKQTAELATSLGVDYLQGYYFSEPLESIQSDKTS
jgi:PAS domain S-box-containing protein/diguanylate cyclase (GGDEF)-like protein